MKTIRYGTKSNIGYWTLTDPSLIFENLHTFIDAVRHALAVDNVVRVVLEPGDATRYDWIISRVDIKEYICMDVSLKQGFHISPSYFDCSAENPYTYALMNDIANRLCQVFVHTYDYHNACPKERKEHV